MADSEEQRERVRGAAEGLGDNGLEEGRHPPAPRGQAPAPGDSHSRALQAGPGRPFLASFFFFKLQGGYNKVGTIYTHQMGGENQAGRACGFPRPQRH